jgi:hypothetical protein
MTPSFRLSVSEGDLAATFFKTWLAMMAAWSDHDVQGIEHPLADPADLPDTPGRMAS